MNFHKSPNFVSFPSMEVYAARQRQSDFSRSLHELASVGLTSSEHINNGRSYLPSRTSHLQYSAIDVSDRPRLPDQPNKEEHDSRPVLRRKRFTRRQRKSVTIEPETGLILAAGPQSSSEDEQVPIRTQSRGLSASTFELSLDTKEDTVDRKKQAPRGPAARRAGRRNNNAKLPYHNAASTSNLDRIDEIHSGLRSDKRSHSVKDLNGQDCDFSNKDSVTHWTSQILAELDSLPSSCVDLSKNKDVPRLDDVRKWSTLLTPSAPPVPTHRPPQLGTRMTQSTYFPSADWQPAKSSTGWQPPMTSSVHTAWQPQSSWMTPMDNRVSSYEYHSNVSLSSANRDREDSLVASTLVGSSTDSDAGTPLAMSPVPVDHLPLLPAGKSSSPESAPSFVSSSLNKKVTSHLGSSMTSSLDRRSIGVQGTETPLFAQRRTSTDSDSQDTFSSSLRIVLSDDSKKVEVTSSRKEELAKFQKPIPAKRTTVTKVEKPTNVQLPPASSPVRLRSNDFLSQKDQILLSNIARLSKSIHGDIQSKEDGQLPDRLSQSSIPSIRTSMYSSMVDVTGGEDSLAKWKMRAECRSRVDISEPQTSVDRVVASMIKSIESSRFEATDRPNNLVLELRPQDVSTQTTPFSISRSSSFDWVNDATEGRLRDLRTPLATPRSALLPLPPMGAESSSETDDADREVAEMTRSVLEQRERHESSNNKVEIQMVTPEEKENKLKLFKEMEDSIAMLLQYGEENKPKPKPRNIQTTTINHTMETPTIGAQEPRRPLPQFPTVSMSESIYDNMAGERKKRAPVPEALSPLSRNSRIVSRDSSFDQEPPTPNQSIREIQSIFRNHEPAERTQLSGGLNVPLSHRAGSCEVLNQETKSPTLLTKEKLEKAEEEAAECCQWLRKAGFPQYATQYEGGEFPCDLRGVRADHPFLEADSLRALFRRLENLNRCAIMRIDNVVLRTRNDNYPYDMYGADDEDNVALSRNWQYQRNSHTWSRVGNEQMYGAPGRTVSTNHNYATYRDPYAVKDTRHSPYDERSERSERSEKRLERYNPNPTPEGSTSGKLQRSQSERIKDTAKALMKKMNPRSGSRRRRESRPRDPSQLQIGDPVLVSFDSASPEGMRMMQSVYGGTTIPGAQQTMPAMYNQPRPTVLQERGRSLADRHARSKSARRQGVVLLSPSSPESSDESFRRHSLLRRDRSVPPQASFHPESSFDRSYEAPSPYANYERFRRERTPMDEYLYAAQHGSMARSKPRLPGGRGYYDSPSNYYGSSGQSSPAYSSPYSIRSFPTPPVRSRQLNIQPDGYYVHGSFEAPESSLSRKPRPFTSSPSTSTAGQQLRVDTLRDKSQSSLDHTDEEPSSSIPSQNRRDSGVGSSLSRSPSGPSTQRIRQSVLPYSLGLSASLTSACSLTWNGKRKQNQTDRLMTASLSSCVSTDEAFFTDEQLLKCMDSLSVIELARIRKLAYLRMTAILEKYMGPGNAMKLESMTSSGNQKRDWTVQKLIKKIKHLDGRTGKETEENTVFGQSLETVYKRTGQCLPRTILEILRYLRQLAPDTVGIFRKNGVKSRISELRQHCDRDAEADVFVDTARLDPGQVHDVADLLKQYLRELPDPLMTARLSEVFANIFMHVPENERSMSLQFALLLLPDENREALQTLLLFLNDVAKYSEVNNMPAQNLSVCFTPSLFHLSASRLDKISSNRRHKTIGAAGMPTEREMRETRAAQMCLSHLITHCRQLFVSPEATSNESGDYEEDAPVLKQLGPHGPRIYLMEKISELVRENADRWKGWIVEGSCDGVEISSRKSPEGRPLRPLRVWVDVPAPPKEVLHRIMKERQVWDVSVVNWRWIDTVQAPDTDLHQYVVNDTLGHPTRDCYLVRHHRTDMPELRGACAVAERSVQCGETQLLGGVAAAVIDSRFLVEPKNGYSRVTHVAAVDLRGRSSNWYNKVYGNILARQMSRLRDSFKKADEFGPETKV